MEPFRRVNPLTLQPTLCSHGSSGSVLQVTWPWEPCLSDSEAFNPVRPCFPVPAPGGSPIGPSCPRRRAPSGLCVQAQGSPPGARGPPCAQPPAEHPHACVPQEGAAATAVGPGPGQAQQDYGLCVQSPPRAPGSQEKPGAKGQKTEKVAVAAELCLDGVELLEGAQGVRRPAGLVGGPWELHSSPGQIEFPRSVQPGDAHVLVGGLGGPWPPTHG